jgi:hypothetical protein
VGQVWDFDFLADEILPLPRAELASLRLERAARRACSKEHPRPSRRLDAATLWESRLAEMQKLLDHRWFGTLCPGQCDAWMLLAGTAVGYLVPSQVVRREIHALARQVTGGHWDEQETASRLSSVIRRAEEAALGRQVEYRGRLIDPRYRFRTETIIDMLGITEAEMRACQFRQLVSPEICRELDRVRHAEKRRANGAVPRAVYEAEAVGNTKPWEAEGISRRTWYRRRGTSASGCMVA